MKSDVPSYMLLYKGVTDSDQHIEEIIIAKTKLSGEHSFLDLGAEFQRHAKCQHGTFLIGAYVVITAAYSEVWIVAVVVEIFPGRGERVLADATYLEGDVV